MQVINSPGLKATQWRNSLGTFGQGCEFGRVVRFIPHQAITKFQTLVCVSSDHNPIVILPEGFCGKAQMPWHFDQLWLDNSGCHDTVERDWLMVSLVISMTSVMTKIEACKQQLTQWSKLTICNVSKTLAEKKNLLKQVKAAAVRGRDVDVFLKLKFEIHDLLRLEEKLRQQ